MLYLLLLTIAFGTLSLSSLNDEGLRGQVYVFCSWTSKNSKFAIKS